MNDPEKHAHLFYNNFFYPEKDLYTFIEKTKTALSQEGESISILKKTSGEPLTANEFRKILYEKCQEYSSHPTLHRKLQDLNLKYNTRIAFYKDLITFEDKIEKLYSNFKEFDENITNFLIEIEDIAHGDYDVKWNEIIYPIQDFHKRLQDLSDVIQLVKKFQTNSITPDEFYKLHSSLELNNFFSMEQLLDEKSRHALLDELRSLASDGISIRKNQGYIRFLAKVKFQIAGALLLLDIPALVNTINSFDHNDEIQMPEEKERVIFENILSGTIKNESDKCKKIIEANESLRKKLKKTKDMGIDMSNFQYSKLPEIRILVENTSSIIKEQFPELYMTMCEYSSEKQIETSLMNTVLTKLQDNISAHPS